MTSDSGEEILSPGEPRSDPGEVPEESGGEQRARGLGEAWSRERAGSLEQTIGSRGKLAKCGHKGALKRSRRRF